MSSVKKITGAVLAASAASVFALAPITATAGEHGNNNGETVHCYNVNSCKGQSECKTATTSCKGQNQCKGTGFVSVSKKACKQLGGSTTEDNGDTE